MTYPIKSPRKLIEVALPLDDINAAAAREKSIRHGHPSTLHLWWARRPLAAARAVLFAQMVNDPGYQQGGGFKYGMNKEAAAKERERLFDIIRKLVKWENTNNEEVLEEARAEIRRSWREVCELNKDHPQAAELFNPDVLPAFHDPFAGGGTIPLEAQRLGLEAYASDLNPVAVLINKAMIEIPPKFAGMPPVNPEARAGKDGQVDLFGRTWKGAEGLAEDVRYYGRWMRERAQEQIGYLYPPVKITEEMALGRPDLKPLIGRELTIVAWLWARTVKSPNPAFSHVDVPLASTFMLSTKKGKEVYVTPVLEGDTYRFDVNVGNPPSRARYGTKTGSSRSDFMCLMSETPMEFAYLRSEAKQGRMGHKLMAIVADSPKGRIYLAPTAEMEAVAASAVPKWKPDTNLPERALSFRIQEYGMRTWADLFTARQLVALTTFCDLIQDANEQIRRDALIEGMDNDEASLTSDGWGARAYAEAVGVYLAFAVSKLADRGSTICTWFTERDSTRNTFARQSIQMTWDYAELNTLLDGSGSFVGALDWTAESVEGLVYSHGVRPGIAVQADAMTQSLSKDKLISTDPPYYDNIGYADLSDFFYVWLRHSQRLAFPAAFATLAVPKLEELVATPFRHGTSQKAEAFFLDGMTRAVHRLVEQAHLAFPVTIYYAFKQAESSGSDGTSSTGWETFLEAVLSAGFSLVGTWPMRTELGNRMVGMGTNALASSIVLVCHRRSDDAQTCSRRDFIRELNAVLPEALAEMTRGSEKDGRSPVAPVDLSQAIIGPGVAVFSKYAAVLEADGTPMSVRTALQLVNRFLAEDDFDADTQFCLHWFDQRGWKAGPFGEADVLARAKGTSVGGVQAAGVVEAGGGSVRLRKWTEYPADWNPQGDTRNPVWETLHQLIRALKNEGETNAGVLLAAVRGKSEATRQLAYRLYTLCERAGWAEDARAYNELITSWDGIEAAASAAPTSPLQSGLFD